MLTYKNKKIISYYPAENVAGMYLIYDDQTAELISFREFAELIENNQPSTDNSEAN